MADAREDQAGGDSWEPGIRHAFKQARIIGKGDQREPSGGPRTASRYEIQGELARDTASVLLLAHDREVDRDVTLRLLDGDGNGDASAVQRFLEEAQIGAQLQHPGILPVYGLGLLDDGRAYVASRMVEGEPLAGLMDRGEHPERLLGVLEQTAQAVAYAHARGVAHGALDATRIHVGAHGEVVISGWERAVRASRDNDPVAADVAALLGLLEQAFGRSIKGKPKSAAGLARAIGRHLAGRESRVREAEVSAATARVKAEREKARAIRSRRQALRESAVRQRTLATVAAVLLIILLGLAGYAFREGEEAAERDRVSTQVAAALREAKRHEAAGDWAEARAWGKNAVALAQGAEEEVREEAEQILSQVERRAQIATEDLVLLSRLEEARWTKEDCKGPYTKVENAFRECGIVLLGADPFVAAQSISSRSVPAEIVAQVDFLVWHMQIHGLERRKDIQDLVEIARIADPAPWVNMLRETTSRADLRALAMTADVPTLPARTLYILICKLIEVEEHALAETVFLEARRRRPDDGQLAYFVAGHVYRDSPVEELSLNRLVLALRAETSIVWASLGRRLLATGDTNGAIAAYRRALAIDPQSVIAHHNLGVTLVESGHREAGLGHFRRAVQLEPHKWEHHAVLGDCLAQSKTPDYYGEAVDVCRRAVKLNENSAEALACLGFALLRNSDLRGAENAYRRALKIDQDLVLAQLRLGVLLCDFLGKPQEAIRHFKAAVKLDPDHAGPCYTNLAVAYIKLEKWRDAEAAARSALRLDPTLATAHVHLGAALVALDRLEEAEAAIRKAIELDPGSAAAHYKYGEALYAARKWEEAAESFQKAIKLDPENFRPRGSLGSILHKHLNDPAGAVREFRAAIKLAPGEPRLHEYLGNALLALRKLAEAAKAYEVAVRLDPNNLWTRNQLGVLLCDHLGKPEAAVQHFQAAIKLAPGVPGHHVCLSEALRASGDYAGAAIALSEAVRLDPKLRIAHMRLGFILQRLGNMKGAKESFRRALGTDTVGVLAANALAWILVTAPDEHDRNPEEALRLAEQAVRLAPQGMSLKLTVGVALYRLGKYEEALSTFENSRHPTDTRYLARDGFFRAMTLWKLGRKREAWRWFGRSDEWMLENAPDHEEFLRFYAEADALLGGE